MDTRAADTRAMDICRNDHTQTELVLKRQKQVRMRAAFVGGEKGRRQGPGGWQWALQPLPESAQPKSTWWEVKVPAATPRTLLMPMLAAAPMCSPAG